MKKETKRMTLDYVIFFGSLTCLVLLSYIFFFADDNFCVEINTDSERFVDDIDKEKKCFRTLAESNNYSSYLIEKYNIGKEDSFLLGEQYNWS